VNISFVAFFFPFPFPFPFPLFTSFSAASTLHKMSMYMTNTYCIKRVGIWQCNTCSSVYLRQLKTCTNS
jgi:hypothetical protein